MESFDVFIAKKYKHKIMNLKLCKMCMNNEEIAREKKEKKKGHKMKTQVW
jgi:hypothetical protein